jgi:O-antigen/teichoic acid export membrane protein
LVVSYGLLKGKGWAWTVTVILTIIAIVIQIISVVSSSMFNASFSADMNALVSGISHIIGLAINRVILYYLYRPHVKTYFGKSKLPTTMPK